MGKLKLHYSPDKPCVWCNIIQYLELRQRVLRNSVKDSKQIFTQFVLFTDKLNNNNTTAEEACVNECTWV